MTPAPASVAVNVTTTSLFCQPLGTSSDVEGACVSTRAATEVLTASALPASSVEKYLIASPWPSFGLFAESYTALAVVGSAGLAPVV